MAAGEPLEPQVFRRNQHRLLLPALYVVPIVLFSYSAVVATPFLWIGTAFWAWLAYRTFRIGVFTSSKGVVVRNVCRSRRLAWWQIRTFAWGRWGGFPIGGAYLLDGSFVKAFALNPPFEFTPGQSPGVPEALEGLNRELERARALEETTSAEIEARAMVPDPRFEQLKLE
jgi:hypothetical protein